MKTKKKKTYNRTKNANFTIYCMLTINTTNEVCIKIRNNRMCLVRKMQITGGYLKGNVSKRYNLDTPSPIQQFKFKSKTKQENKCSDNTKYPQKPDICQISDICLYCCISSYSHREVYHNEQPRNTILQGHYSLCLSFWFQIESQKLNFKDKAQSKVGSKDNMDHKPLGGDKKVGLKITWTTTH